MMYHAKKANSHLKLLSFYCWYLSVHSEPVTSHAVYFSHSSSKYKNGPFEFMRTHAFFSKVLSFNQKLLSQICVYDDGTTHAP